MTNLWKMLQHRMNEHPSYMLTLIALNVMNENKGNIMQQ